MPSKGNEAVHHHTCDPAAVYPGSDSPLNILLAYYATLSQAKPQHASDSGAAGKDSPKGSSVSFHQGILAIFKPRLLGDGRSDGGGDGQADRVAELGYYVEDTASEGLDFWWKGFGDDQVRCRE